MKKKIIILIILVISISCSHGQKNNLKGSHGMNYKPIYDKISEQDVITKISKKQGVNVPEAVSIKDIVYSGDYRVLFVGEQHDSYAHHYNQLAVIIEMHKRYKHIAIGMEMFQKPFQKVLDNYIAGNISELEMLEQAEYFERWSFDYNLYKPILNYAKDNGIQIIALNVPTKITKKISSSGLDSLEMQEKEVIAKDIDFSNEIYKERLRKIFEMHASKLNFDYFYQAQLAWDETMAETAANFVSKSPDINLIVLAGNGHINHGYGIPDRFKRRVDAEAASIVQDMAIVDAVADYLLFPEDLNIKPTPRLGAKLEVDKKGLKVQQVVKGSFAMKAGIKDGDILLKVNGRVLKKVSDLRLMLYKTQSEEDISLLLDREGASIPLNIKLK